MVDEILIIICETLFLQDVVSVRLEILSLAVQGNTKLCLFLLEDFLNPASNDHANLDQVGDLSVGPIQIGLVNPAFQAIIKTANRLTIASPATLSRFENLRDLSSDNDTAVECLLCLFDEQY